MCRPGVSFEDRPAKRSRSSAAALPGQERESTGPVESTPEGDVMDVQFITSVAVITPDPGVSRRLYVDALGLALTAEGDGYLHSEDIDGCKSFGVWPLTGQWSGRCHRRASSSRSRTLRPSRPQRTS